MVLFSKFKAESTTLTHHIALAAAAAMASSITAWKIYTYFLEKSQLQRQPQMDDVKVLMEKQHGVEEAPKKRKKKASVNGVFFRRLYHLLKILIPGAISPETGYMLLAAASIVATTYCDLWVMENTTHIQAAIVGRHTLRYTKHLMAYVYAMPLLAFTDKLLKISLDELRLRFRTTLSKYLYDKYLQGCTCYQMNNIDTRISNPDQLLTQDTEKFCDGLTLLFSNMAKPLLVIALFVTQVTNRIGATAPASLISYLFVSGTLLTMLRDPIGRLTAEQQKLEGEFRYANSRLITNSQEVAFYNGTNKERSILLAAYQRLVSHVRKFIQFKFVEGFVDNILAKYLPTLVGRLVVSFSFLQVNSQRHENSTQGQRLKDYFQSMRLLFKVAESIGMVASAGKEMVTLAGFTERISHLLDVLEDLSKGRYERTMLLSDQQTRGSTPLTPGAGSILNEDNIIKFEHIPLVTPNGDVLIEDMSFEVKSGVNVLVCGPNGCGKSSLFRVLGELWPLFGGTLTKPEKGKLFYVPQRPYMTLGTLRDQIIYPDTKDDMRRKRVLDSHLITYLDKVQLGYILEREGGWESVQDWMDVLSGGEKQRITMARLFYHKPQFAILDECTSAVSVDVEGAMYQCCKETGITLFTVSHRKSLWAHHEFFLRLDGKGGYKFLPITEEESLFK